MTDRPDTATSAHPADLLSRVLGTIRLAGEQVDILHFQPGDAVDRTRISGGCLFMLAAGDARLRTPDAASLPIAEGELVLLTEGFGSRVLEAGSAGCELLLGRFRVDEGALRGTDLALPDLVHIDRELGASWLDGIARFLRAEATDFEPGASLMASRLIDLIVVRTLRSWAHQGRAIGWLSGTTDPRIARVLADLHDDPSRRWTLDTMATLAGMSRSSFCDRFAALVGTSPLRYGNELRLGIARRLLENPDARISRIAVEVGYGSEAAFSRAYKAMFGRAPAFDRQNPRITTSQSRLDRV